MIQLLRASEAFADTHRIELVLLDDEARAYPVPDGAIVHQLDSGSNLWRSLRGFYALAKREKPDVTLAFLSRSNFVTVIAGKLLGHGTVISERVNTSGHFSKGLSATISKALIRLIYPRADAVIAVSNGIASDLSSNFAVQAERITTIDNPVDIKRIAEAASEPVAQMVEGRYAIAISRLSANKNAILTVEALAASGTDLSLLILGQGPEREAILARAQALGVANRVVMPGFLPNPYPYLKGAACYLSGSNAEGFPNGLVEALALGVPAISTNCPSGPSEILAERSREDVSGTLVGPYGILVPQNDAEAMGKALCSIVEPERSAYFRESGPNRAAHYSVENARDRYWDVLNAVLARKRRNAG